MLSSLSLYAPPVGYVLFVWWFSTGLILYLDNLPPRTHRWSMLGATVLLAAALHLLRVGSNDASLSGAYAAFTCGLLVWGWQEMSFFMGFITGPRREACPPDCTGWARFRRAVQACLYHEVASLAAGGAVIAATAGGVNQIGLWTYLVLWSMRLSSKFNVFFGVRNLSEAFIPEHLAFIRSFLRQRPMNLLFPFSVTFASVFAVILVQRAAAADASAFTATGITFVAVLLILAICEHWFLVLPLPVEALWRWSLAARQPARPAGPPVRLRWRSALSSAMPGLARVSVQPQRTIGGDP